MPTDDQIKALEKWAGKKNAFIIPRFSISNTGVWEVYELTRNQLTAAGTVDIAAIKTVCELLGYNNETTLEMIEKIAWIQEALAGHGDGRNS